MTPSTAQTVFDFSFADIASNAYLLAQHRGKVLLVVDTASSCDFTPQLAGLQQLHAQ